MGETNVHDHHAARLAVGVVGQLELAVVIIIVLLVLVVVVAIVVRAALAVAEEMDVLRDSATERGQ